MTSTPEDPPSDPPHDAEPEAEAGSEAAWWDDPGMPWRHEPTRADVVCLTFMGIASVYTLVMLPLRPTILGLAPPVVGALGYHPGLVLVGALAAGGDPWWPLVLALSTLAGVKFDWIYWWAGRLWGRGIMDVWAASKSERTQRRWRRVWELTQRYATPAIVLTFLPLPIPTGVVYAALGAAGTSLRTFLIVGFCASAVTTAGYLALGYAIGEPAVAVIDTYGWVLYFVSLAIVVGMIATYVWRQRRGRPDAEARP